MLIRVLISVLFTPPCLFILKGDEIQWPCATGGIEKNMEREGLKFWRFVKEKKKIPFVVFVERSHCFPKHKAEG